jgi:HAD superfamily hydrolase (TIGR01509 family)
MAKSRAALLFDIDGTLVNTDALHLTAFNRVFGPRGHVFDHRRFSDELQGFSMASIRERFLGHERPERQLAIMEEKEAIFRELAKGGVPPSPGLMALLDRADRAGVPYAAVTNAPRLNAEMMLAGLGVADRFKVLVIGDELEHGKPHPLAYQEGLRLLGADAEHSVAFEDSRSGIQSATAAGIATVGMLTSLSAADALAAGAVIAAQDFADERLVGLVRERIGV